MQDARRELEHQRQMELERHRHDQLMSEKIREQTAVDQLSAEVGQLCQKHDVLVSQPISCLSISYRSSAFVLLQAQC